MIGATQGRMAIDQTEHTASRAVVLKKKIETHTHTHKKRRKKERKKERKKDRGRRTGEPATEEAETRVGVAGHDARMELRGAGHDQTEGGHSPREGRVRNESPAVRNLHRRPSHTHTHTHTRML